MFDAVGYGPLLRATRSYRALLALVSLEQSYTRYDQRDTQKCQENRVTDCFYPAVDVDSYDDVTAVRSGFDL